MGRRTRNNMKRPYPLAVGHEIVTWLKNNWQNAWWGLVDCDRCPQRTEAHPCPPCRRWSGLIEDFRTGDLLVPLREVRQGRKGGKPDKPARLTALRQ